MDHSEAVREVYGRMEKHIGSIPYLDQSELYNSAYTYKRQDVNLKLARAVVEVSKTTNSSKE